jgi:hypothetical protein
MMVMMMMMMMMIKRQKVTGDGRKLHREWLFDLHCVINGK